MSYYLRLYEVEDQILILPLNRPGHLLPLPLK